MGTGSSPVVKWAGRGIDHPPPSSTKVKERVELYLYSPFGLRGLFCGELYLYQCTTDNSCVKAGVFESGTFFSLKMVCNTPKHLGETWYRYVINKECAFTWCN
jgi:hypothetical protein